MEIRQFLATVRRRWKLVVAFLVLGLACAAVITTTLTPRYSSESRLFISTQATDVVDPYAGALFSMQRASSYAELAKDPAIMQKVIDKVGLNLTPGQLAADITTEAVPNSVILSVVATADNPYVAQNIAEAEAEQVADLIATLEQPKDSKQAPPIRATIAGKASFSANAVSPNLMLNLVAGALLGLLLGVSAAVLRDLFDVSIRTAEDVQTATRSTVLATVPFDPTVVEHPLISDREGHNHRIEAFRVLRTNLQFANLDAKSQTLVVTSALPDEGKTVTATNLAIAMAQTGRAVLLIDCDFRKPTVADLLGLENSVGLLTILVGQASFEETVQQHESGVDFLGTGPKPPNPAEVLETQVMRDLLNEVCQHYDVVIIDAPPLLPVADPAILASEVEGVLLVTRHGKTNRDQLALAVDRLDAVGGNILGAVFNMTPRRGEGSYGGYGYGGYGYGTTAMQDAARELPGKRPSFRHRLVNHSGQKS